MNRSIILLTAIIVAGCDSIVRSPTPVPPPPSVIPRDRLMREESTYVPSAAPASTAGGLPTG